MSHQVTAVQDLLSQIASGVTLSLLYESGVLQENVKKIVTLDMQMAKLHITRILKKTPQNDVIYIIM